VLQCVSRFDTEEDSIVTLDRLVSCSVLQCVAVCCSVLQYVASFGAEEDSIVTFYHLVICCVLQ